LLHLTLFILSVQRTRFTASFAGGKDIIFFLYNPNLFLTFFEVFFDSFLSVIVMNLSVNAGAKVTLLFTFPNLLQTFF